MTLPSITLYAGLFLALAGLTSILWPLRRVGIRTRARASLIAAAGLLLAGAALLLPVRTARVHAADSHLDQFMPEWQFSERHEIRIAAPPGRVYAALRLVTADEIFLFRWLTWIRRGGRPGPEDILNAPGDAPLLDVATTTTFVWLADDRPRELVVGTRISAPPGERARSRPTVRDFRAPTPPGIVLATMNFLIVPDGSDRSVLTTETRVRAGDAASARRFAVYWRLIHPGSDLIRRTWLRAVKRRAERPDGNIRPPYALHSP